MHNYTLIRSGRKSAALHIKPDATVEVRAPLRMPKADIDKFVISKESWINRKLVLVRERQEKKAAFNLNYGDDVMVFGKECIIVPSSAANPAGYDDERLYIPPNLTSEQIKHACIRIYKLIAGQVLINKTVAFSKLMGVEPRAVKISSAKTLWGSCSKQRSINYSWRLVMTEDYVIDYVVVHELAHITEMNHSDRFWAIVADLLPDYKVRRKRLKILQQRLRGEDWD